MCRLLKFKKAIMNTVNTLSQPFDFSGSVPKHYDQFSGPMFFEPYAIEVSNRIDSSPIDVALELASGTGRVTRHLRAVLGSKTKLVASDISPDMLAVAKEKLQALDINWEIIDAQRLPFEADSIGLIVCCFGYMFVPDKPKAFAEVYRVLRPGGMFLFTTWDRLEYNAASYTSRTIAKEYLEEPLPESYNLATSMSDEAVINPLLQNAGFSKISIEKVARFSVSPTAKQATYGLVEGGLIYKEIKKRNPAWIDEIKIKVEKELAEKFGDAPMIAPMSAVMSQAWK